MSNLSLSKYGFTPKLLSLAILSSLPGMAPAQDDGSSQIMEEIIVSGFRRSLMDSVSLKQDSQSIVEAISAEDIGKLPDVSIAESLARLPGLAAQRLNGRGQVISVRGLSPDFTTALLNGRQQVSTGDNRGVEFDQYPSELLGGVVVYKTPDASLLGQGLAGTADMRTIRPLEHGEKVITGNIRYEWNEYDALNAGADDSGIRYSASYIDQFADDTLGLVMGVSSMSSPYQGERWNAWGYPDSGDGNYVIGGAKPFVRSSELARDSFMGVVEYMPNSNFATTLDLYYSNFEETQWLRGIEFPLFWSSADLQAERSVSNGLITQGTFNDVKAVMRNDVGKRDADLWAAGWKTEFTVSEDWTLTVDLSHSEVERTDIILETYSGTGTDGEGATDNIGFSLSGSQGAVFSTNLDYTDPNLIRLTSPQGWGGDIVPGGQVGYFNQPTIEDELSQLSLSALRDMDGPINTLEFGLSINTREKSLINDQWFMALANGATSAPITPNGITSLDFLGIPGMVSYDPLATVASGTYNLVRNPNADVVSGNWHVEEDVSLAFVQLGIDTSIGNLPLTGNFGLQVIHTDQSSSGFASEGTGDATLSIPVTDGAKYTEYLPSLNLSFEISDQEYIRLAAARTLARARMDEMSASQKVNFNPGLADSTDISQSPWSGEGGNPRLRPWIANAMDLSYERYFDDGLGYISMAIFYKSLRTYIYDQRELGDFTGFPTNNGIEPALRQGVVTTPQNGEGGTLKGMEFSLSLSGDMFTSALEGFGMVFSASFNDSEIVHNPGSPSLPLPGLSEKVANLTLYYENEGFSARISDRYRSRFLGEVAGFGNGRTLRLVEPESIIDAQVSYQFDSGSMEGLTLLFQGSNLTDEPFTTTEIGDRRRIIDYQQYGRTYIIGLSYKY